MTNTAHSTAALAIRWLDVIALLAVAAAGVIGSQMLGPTTPAGNVVALAGVVGALALVLWLRRRRREPWSSLGLVWPASWGRVFGISLAATIVVIALVGAVETLVIRPLLSDATADVSRFESLRGNLPALLGSIVAVWLTAAIAEEVIYRGFLMGRIAVMFGGSRAAWLGSLMVSSALFGALHLYQGAAGVVLTGLAGLLLGSVYLITGRNLWICILTHGLMDTISLTLVYFGFG